jgi:hypothetical protein
MLIALSDCSAEPLGIRADPPAQPQRTRAWDVVWKPARHHTTVRVNPLASFLWPMLSSVSVRMLPVCLSPLRHSPPNRVAGIVAVLDDSQP